MHRGRTWRVWWIMVFWSLIVALMSQTVLGQEKMEPSLTLVKICALPFLTASPVFIAMEEGYFAEQGIEIELVRFRSTAESIPALAQGQLDVSTGTVSANLFNAAARGLDIKVVADKGHINPGDRWSAVVVRKELYESGQLRNLRQLKGKVVHFVHPGGMAEYRMQLILAQYNLSLDDIERVYVSWPAAIQALQTGAIDATMLGEPQVTRVLSEGFGTVLAYYGDLYRWLAPAAQIGTVLFGPNLLQDDRSLGRRFMLAYLKGVRTYNQGKTSRNLEIISQYTKLDPELLRRCNLPSIHPEGSLNLESLLAFQKWLYQKGLVDQIVPAENLIDESFSEWASQALRESD